MVVLLVLVVIVAGDWVTAILLRSAVHTFTL